MRRDLLKYLLLIGLLVIAAALLFPYMVPENAKGFFPDRP